LVSDLFWPQLSENLERVRTNKISLDFSLDLLDHTFSIFLSLSSSLVTRASTYKAGHNRRIIAKLVIQS